VHSKDWPWSSWSYYEKGENRLIAIDLPVQSGTKEQTQPGTGKANPAPLESPLVAQSFLAVHSKDWPLEQSATLRKGREPFDRD
jgi:hypothetical protein